MNKLTVDFENCFGIGKLNHEFDFTRSKTFLVYAPNGTMKTSFAKTLDLISKNDPQNMPCDRVYNARVSKYDVQTDNVAINPDNILVVNAEDNSFDASGKISAFLASKELKKKYDDIYVALDDKKADFIKRLKAISQSTDCETEFVSAFADEDNSSFFEILLAGIGDLKNKFDKTPFRYNDVFDKKGNVKKFLDKNQGILDQYISDYKNIISKSKFFKESVANTFGTYQANEILKSIEDNSFFEAGHKFVLEDGTEVENSAQLKQIVETEIQNILNDDKLKKSFDKMDKAISANSELRVFQRVVEKDKLMLIKLKDYENFKKEVWINYLSEIKQESEILAHYYAAQKEELKSIIDEAKNEFALWTKIIQTFNSRFYVPFKIVLVNQEDIVLKEQTANIEFDYSDRNDAPVRQKRESLLNILSKGEQRAYFILQFLFEIESRKLNPETNLLIFDDVADSFDYKNKFAIIEYIKDLHDHLSNFRLIILTHNFDFYRTVASRLGLPRAVFSIATQSNTKEITLHSGHYIKDIFAHFLTRYAEPKVFISLITFVRNLIEYSESDNCPEYLTLTSCLHKKATSDNLTANDIFNIYTSRLVKLNGKTIPFGNDNLIQLIKSTAQSISDDVNVNEVFVENKITLAIAIRLHAEEYLIGKLPGLDLNNITYNQTQVLFKAYRSQFPNSASLETLDKVNLMTPENIHINAFMFEPLIDMSIRHLIDLYRATTNLN